MSGVQVQLIAKVIGGRRMPAELRYDVTDPWAVTLVFPYGDDHGNSPPWRISRELLAAGLREPAGIADVRIWPSEDGVLLIRLTGTNGCLTFTVVRHRVVAFLARTYLLVPDGSEAERVDMDAELRQILGGVS